MVFKTVDFQQSLALKRDEIWNLVDQESGEGRDMDSLASEGTEVQVTLLNQKPTRTLQVRRLLGAIQPKVARA